MESEERLRVNRDLNQTKDILISNYTLLGLGGGRLKDIQIPSVLTVLIIVYSAVIHCVLLYTDSAIWDEMKLGSILIY